MVADVIDAIRAVLYALIGIELVGTAKLYRDGYLLNRETRKQLSPIIWALWNFLFWVGSFFVFLAIVPIIKIISKPAYLVAVQLLTIPLPMVYYFARKFNKYTLDNRWEGKNKS